MLAWRALPLLLLFSAQVIAGGLGAAEHRCRAKAARTACACKAKDKVHAPVAVQAQPCCTEHFTRSELPDGRAEAARAMPERLDVAPGFAVLTFVAVAAAPAVEQQQRQRAPEHGPPIFVKQRRLLL